MIYSELRLHFFGLQFPSYNREKKPHKMESEEIVSASNKTPPLVDEPSVKFLHELDLSQLAPMPSRKELLLKQSASLKSGNYKTRVKETILEESPRGSVDTEEEVNKLVQQRAKELVLTDDIVAESKPLQ